MQPSSAKLFWAVMALSIASAVGMANNNVLRVKTAEHLAAPTGVGDVKDVAYLLPYHPARQPEAMFKGRCVNFLNQALERGAYEADLTLKMLPKCMWSKAECKTLQDNLIARLKEQSDSESFLAKGMRGSKNTTQGKMMLNGPAGPPPPPISGVGERLYGWCDFMYNMMKNKTIAEMPSSNDTSAF